MANLRCDIGSCRNPGVVLSQDGDVFVSQENFVSYIPIWTDAHQVITPLGRMYYQTSQRHGELFCSSALH